MIRLLCFVLFIPISHTSILYADTKLPVLNKQLSSVVKTYKNIPSTKDENEVQYVLSDDVINLNRVMDRRSVLININKRYKDGDTLLMMAVRRSNYGVVKTLLSRSADPNAVDIGGASPLHIAVRRNDKKVLDLLLSSKQVDINLQDIEGYTPLMRAVELGFVEIVEVLTSRGAAKNIKNSYGMSAYDLVNNVNSKDIRQKIIKILD